MTIHHSSSRPASSEYACVASVLACFAKSSGPAGAEATLRKLPAGFEVHSEPAGRRQLAFKRRHDPTSTSRGAETTLPKLLLLGDDFELGGEGEVMGNATSIRCDLERGSLDAVVSMPGLPALYVAESDTVTAITSDPILLTFVEGLSLRFDARGILDLARVGNPVAYRTLFRGVRMLAGGSVIALRDQAPASVRNGWTPPDREPFDSWDEYTELQAATFDEAMGALTIRTCALSLSGGLDSRATLAGLIKRNASVEALTVSGENPCLDARSAAAVCKAYGIPHRTIKLDSSFRGMLPELVDEASRLSGGISSVWHAAQVYSYRVLGSPSPFNALSGYLGNQVGRRGTEGLTPRDADLAILAPTIRESPVDPARSWYAHAMQPSGFLETSFLIQQESTFGNLASYQVGNAHSVQQSAYAFLPLIENMWRLPDADPPQSSGSIVQNLKHLFMGEPMEESFQRRYINRSGGVVASYPINWGWRSRGGVSPVGAAKGALALVDALVASRYPETFLAGLTRTFGIAGLHEFRPVHQWLHDHMRSFVHDTVLSRASLESGVFDRAAVTRALEAYYSEGRGFKEVVLALDLALAAKNFSATA